MSHNSRLHLLKTYQVCTCSWCRYPQVAIFLTVQSVGCSWDNPCFLFLLFPWQAGCMELVSKWHQHPSSTLTPGIPVHLHIRIYVRSSLVLVMRVKRNMSVQEWHLVIEVKNPPFDSCFMLAAVAPQHVFQGHSVLLCSLRRPMRTGIHSAAQVLHLFKWFRTLVQDC